MVPGTRVVGVELLKMEMWRCSDGAIVGVAEDPNRVGALVWEQLSDPQSYDRCRLRLKVKGAI